MCQLLLLPEVTRALEPPWRMVLPPGEHNGDSGSLRVSCNRNSVLGFPLVAVFYTLYAYHGFSNDNMDLCTS